MIGVLSKGKAATVGESRQWKGRTYVKQPDGRWKRSPKSDRGSRELHSRASRGIKKLTREELTARIQAKSRLDADNMDLLSGESVLRDRAMGERGGVGTGMESDAGFAFMTEHESKTPQDHRHAAREHDGQSRAHARQRDKHYGDDGGKWNVEHHNSEYHGAMADAHRAEAGRKDRGDHKWSWRAGDVHQAAISADRRAVGTAAGISQPHPPKLGRSVSEMEALGQLRPGFSAWNKEHAKRLDADEAQRELPGIFDQIPGHGHDLHHEPSKKGQTMTDWSGKLEVLEKAKYVRRTGTPGHYKYEYHEANAKARSSAAHAGSGSKMDRHLAHEEAADAHSRAAKHARITGQAMLGASHQMSADRHLGHADYSENLSPSEREQAFHHYTEKAKHAVDPAGGTDTAHEHAAMHHENAADHAIQLLGHHRSEGNAKEAKRWSANAKMAATAAAHHKMAEANAAWEARKNELDPAKKALPLSDMDLMKAAYGSAVHGLDPGPYDHRTSYMVSGSPADSVARKKKARNEHGANDGPYQMTGGSGSVSQSPADTIGSPSYGAQAAEVTHPVRVPHQRGTGESEVAKGPGVLARAKEYASRALDRADKTYKDKGGLRDPRLPRHEVQPLKAFKEGIFSGARGREGGVNPPVHDPESKQGKQSWLTAPHTVTASGMPRHSKTGDVAQGGKLTASEARRGYNIGTLAERAARAGAAKQSKRQAALYRSVNERTAKGPEPTPAEVREMLAKHKSDEKMYSEQGDEAKAAECRRKYMDLMKTAKSRGIY